MRDLGETDCFVTVNKEFLNQPRAKGAVIVAYALGDL